MFRKNCQLLSFDNKTFLERNFYTDSEINTDEIRRYLVDYQARNNCSKITVDNVRRNLSSFFSWLEEEDYILKSPMRRIHKVKTKVEVKETISDENIEKYVTRVRNCEMLPS